MCKEEFDRLMETSPVIPDDIVDLFNKSFNGKTQNAIEDIIKPEVCDSLISTKQCRNPWYTEENMQKQQTKQFKEKIEKAAEIKRIHKHNVHMIEEFKKNFYNLNNRNAMDEEIIDNLHDQIEPDIIRNIIVNFKSTKQQENGIDRTKSSENNTSQDNKGPDLI